MAKFNAKSPKILEPPKTFFWLCPCKVALYLFVFYRCCETVVSTTPSGVGNRWVRVPSGQAVGCIGDGVVKRLMSMLFSRHILMIITLFTIFNQPLKNQNKLISIFISETSIHFGIFKKHFREIKVSGRATTCKFWLTEIVKTWQWKKPRQNMENVATDEKHAKHGFSAFMIIPCPSVPSYNMSALRNYIMCSTIAVILLIYRELNYNKRLY